MEAAISRVSVGRAPTGPGVGAASALARDACRVGSIARENGACPDRAPGRLRRSSPPVSRRGRRGVSPRLSFCVITRSASGRVAAIVELVRPVADEVVIGVDDRATPADVAALEPFADDLRLFPYSDPADS